MIVRKPLRVGWLILAGAAVLQMHTTCQTPLPGTGTPGGGSSGGTGGTAPATAADSFEPDDLTGQAWTLNENEPQVRTIYPGGDVDYLTFTLSATSPVTIEATSAG